MKPFSWFKKDHAGKQASSEEKEIFWALKDVSFEVTPGEVVGIIGRNGAGKSTLLKVLSRITEPTSGRVEINGRVASLLEVGTGFHPDLTGRENVFLNGAILGMSRAEIRKKFDEIVAFAEVEKFLDTPVKRYSSGMYVRLAFAVAAHLEPDILVVDEVLAVGDVEFQKKCLGKMKDVAGQGRTVLFVSHNIGVVKELCSRAILLKAGRILADGSTSQVVGEYIAQAKTSSSVRLTEEDQRGPRKFSFIHQISLMNDKGEPSADFFMGEPLIAQILVEVKQPVKQVEIGLKLSSRYGAPIHFLTSSWEGCSPDLPIGRHLFEVRLNEVLLYPGVYLVGLWFSKGLEWSDSNVQDIATITVHKSNITGYPTRMEEYTISGSEVYADNEWKLLPQESP